MNPWDNDVAYSEELVADIVTRGTSLTVSEVSFLGAGFDNSVYLINREFVFRFVRRLEGLDFIKHELIALPHLAGRLPLAIPNPVYRGIFQDQWIWIGYPFLAGRPFYETGLADEQRNESAQTFARFLRSLHSEDVSRYLAAGLPKDWLGHMDLSKRLPFCREKLEILVRKNLIQHKPAYHELLEAVSQSNASQVQTLVHGDFKATHILFDGATPTAVIDWGDVHIGHPATDLAIAYTFFPPAGREQFIEEYGVSDESLWRLAQFRAFYHTLAIIEYTHATGQSVLLNEAFKALMWAFEE